jgi:threonylcarbamoyladenosine tRNA methylthiotransferase MtaB
MPAADIITLGCRLNAYESEVMRGHLAAAGIDDAIVVNTCAVTGEAVRQAAQTIRRLKRERPGARIIVTGCAAEIEPERFAAMNEVDQVIGNAEKTKRATFDAIASGAADRVVVGAVAALRVAETQPVDGFTSRARATIAVQNGCDHRCTFCIIPFGRGPSRSVPAGAVVAQVQAVVEKGYREVVLTGVDLTSYGADLPGTPTLGRLVRQILKHVPELERLRLSSIDQVEADPHLMAAIAEEPRLMPHLHLSLQSGDDLILKRMKRRHQRADAIRFTAEARRLRPDIVFGADFIAGFPTETEAMFERTLRHVEECGLTYLHVFPFSPRQGTPAARMPQVAGPVISERAARLREVGNRALDGYLARQVGREVEVLVEGRKLARTPQFAEVEIDAPALLGRVTRVRLKAKRGRRLVGEVAA